MKKSLLISTTLCLLSLNSLAADDVLVQQGTEQVTYAQRELTAIIRSLGGGSNMPDMTRKLTQVQRRLVSAERSLQDSLNDAGYPPPYPGNNRVIMSAKCEVDDDVDFNPGQADGGTIKGPNIRAILADCEAIARAQGSSGYSFGISTIQIVQKPANYVQAKCEIDDDPDFNPGQFALGSIAGRDFGDVMTQCKSIAHATYKEKGSAGINTPVIDPTQFAVTADCHIDDDVDFNPDQFVFGKIGARSIVDATAQCALIARETYGDKGSSGLRNIVQN